MNTQNCCRVCLEDSYSVVFTLQEYHGNSTIGDMIKSICPDVNVSCQDQNLKIAIAITSNNSTTELLVQLPM